MKIIKLRTHPLSVRERVVLRRSRPGLDLKAFRFLVRNTIGSPCQVLVSDVAGWIASTRHIHETQN